MASLPLSHSVPTTFHLFGQLDYDHALALQRRIAYETSGFQQERITVLVCEHPPLITVGRRGSRGHVRMTNLELRRSGLALRWMGRGGGCVLHGPGQLAIYPIVPLESVGWSVGQLLDAVQRGILRLLESLRIQGQTWEGHAGVWGRTGLLAAVGLTVRNWVSHHGIFLNVNPPVQHYGYVDTVPASPERPSQLRSTMSCLVAERQEPVKMTQVRAQLAETLGCALGCATPALTTGHPLLRKVYENQPLDRPA